MLYMSNLYFFNMMTIYAVSVLYCCGGGGGNFEWKLNPEK